MKVTYLQGHHNTRIGLVVPYYDLEIGDVGTCGHMYFKRSPDGSMSIGHGNVTYSPWISSAGILRRAKEREFTSLMVEIIDES